MPTPQQRKEKLDSVSKVLAQLSKVDPTSLARTSDLSPDINFKDAVPFFEELLDLCKQLSQRDLSRLPSNDLDAINNACNTITAHVKEVQEFTLNQNTPGDVCKSITTKIENAYDGIMKPMLLPLAFTATQATDYAKIEREAKGYHATMKAEAEKLAAFIKISHQDAENALAAVKEQAAEAGVSTNAQIFVTQAAEHGQLARRWMIGTIVMASLTFVAAIIAVVIAFKYHPPTTAAAVQYVFAKLVVLSTLSFGIYWCARNFKSQKHNQTLNKHRANALMTFRAFVEGTADERVKDSILLQAAQAAFAGRQTGYDGHEKNAQTINPVVEILGKSLGNAGDGA